MGLEVGKWLLDVAKYMLTALLLANFFGDMNSPGTIFMAIILMVMLFGLGLWLIHENDGGKNDKVKNNKKKGKSL